MEETQLFIIIGLGTVILVVIVYFIIKYSKGKIKINLPKTSFQIGDQIAGTLDLEVKRHIEGYRLFVAIVQYEKIRERGGRNGGYSTRTNELSRFEVDLEGSRQYQKGLRTTYNFEIPFPDQNINKSKSIKTGNNTVDSVMKGISFLTNISSTIEWKIEARLDAKGLDLTTSKKVYFNFKNKNTTTFQN